MNFPLQIMSTQWLAAFAEKVDETALRLALERAPSVEITADVFGFYSSVASVFSSKIEGEDIELDSYLRHRFLQGKYQPDYTQKVDDLYAAYLFARDNRLTFKHLLKTHARITRHILAKTSQGKIRAKPEIIVNAEGKIKYVAADASIVKPETEKLFADLKTLLAADLSLTEAFYFAALAHLVFLKIHPFEDGNGRTARLLEKWFLAEKIGPRAWNIPTEKYYCQNLKNYYRNVHIGFDYENLDYSRCLPLLWMPVAAALSAD
jgi:Fic family protein